MAHQQNDSLKHGNQISSRQESNRRRALLLAAAKSSGVLLATSVPVKALATQSTCTHPDANAPQIRCGISGIASGIGSRETYVVCTGYSPGYWGQEECTTDYSKKKKWGSHSGTVVCKPRRTWPCAYDQRYTTIFTNPSPKAGSQLRMEDGVTVPTLFDIVRKGEESKFSNTDMYHWVCAYLNALGGGPTGNFPYTASEVVVFCSDTGKYSYEQALYFFKTYMETHKG